MIGRRLSHFRILDRIGQGGMGPDGRHIVHGDSAAFHVIPVDGGPIEPLRLRTGSDVKAVEWPSDPTQLLLFARESRE